MDCRRRRNRRRRRRQIIIDKIRMRRKKIMRKRECKDLKSIKTFMTVGTAMKVTITTTTRMKNKIIYLSRKKE